MFLFISYLFLFQPQRAQRARRRNITSHEIAGNESQIFVFLFGYSGKQLYQLLAISTRGREHVF